MNSLTKIYCRLLWRPRSGVNNNTVRSFKKTWSDMNDELLVVIIGNDSVFIEEHYSTVHAMTHDVVIVLAEDGTAWYVDYDAYVLNATFIE